VTIHYHGTPITPTDALYKLSGRNFCVSFANPQQVAHVHKIGQSVMLDNGAFTAWSSGASPDWRKYYSWAEKWLDHRTTWCVIPDAIDGDEDANDALIRDWPHGNRGAPVWHLHESIGRLLALSSKWDRVCIGSSGDYKSVGTPRWHMKMIEAMNALCGNGPSPVWLHMLRGMNVADSIYPFASVDSTDIARNHHLGTCPSSMASRWDSLQSPGRWVVRPVQEDIFGGK